MSVEIVIGQSCPIWLDNLRPDHSNDDHTMHTYKPPIEFQEVNRDDFLPL